MIIIILLLSSLLLLAFWVQESWGAGRLDKADLMRMVEDRKLKLEAKKARKTGGGPGATDAADATPTQTRMGVDEEMRSATAVDSQFQ